MSEIDAAQDSEAGGSRSITGLPQARDVADRLRERLRETIVGRDDVIDAIVIALLAGGHVLLEDFPGSGKTMLARALGESIVGDGDVDPRIVPFRRVQFTPDLLPSDITGVSVFEPERGSFEFIPGPVFAHVLLADEINRTSPKVQSALLEAMAERQVTVDNVTHRLDDLFLVIATQNPLGMAGTFPLPAPQLDRFLFKIRMVPIAREAELDVVTSFRKRLRPVPAGTGPGVSRRAVLTARRAVEDGVAVARPIAEALVDLARGIRADPRVALGVSTRALVQAVPAMQARALLLDRDYVSAEDLQALAVPLLAHRLVLAAGSADAVPVIEEALVEPLEALARSTLTRT